MTPPVADRPALDPAVGTTVGRFAPATLCAAAWTAWAVVRTRRGLRKDGLAAPRVTPPARLPWGAGRGVLGVLRRLEPTCLERSLVLQSWLTSHGRRYDVVVGVAATGGAMRAHAWLGYEIPTPDSHGYRELYRIPPA